MTYQTQTAANQLQHRASLIFAGASRQSLSDRLNALFGNSKALQLLPNGTSLESQAAAAELKSVSINQISGTTAGRSNDFSADFKPLNDHTRKRWLSIASARLQGMKMPPVALIQMGDTYFVQDGHHRISVAAAMGDETIEANVTIWQQVDSPSLSIN